MPVVFARSPSSSPTQRSSAPSAPRPVAGYTETILRLIGIVFGAIAKADPARATAAPFGTINALSMSGHRADGSRWVMFSFFGGGLGGNPAERRAQPRQQPDLDRDHPAGRDPRGGLSGPVHAMGARGPIPAAPAAHRGGLGAIYEIEALTDARSGTAWRAGQVSALRRSRRRAGRAEPLLLAGGGRAGNTPPLVSQGHRREAPRPASACGSRRRAAAAGAIRASATPRAADARSSGSAT